MQQLGALDNLMVGGEIPNTPLHISAIMLYETSHAEHGVVLFEKLQEMLGGIIENHLPILRCRIEDLPLHMDKAYWVDDPGFNLADHTTRVALPAPHDWQELYRLFGQFHAQPLNMKKPLWQMMLVEGLDALDGIPAGSIALFSKMHHGMMDGKSAMRLLRSFHSLGPEPDAAPLAEHLPHASAAEEDYRAPPWWIKYGRAWWKSIERPVDLAATLAKMLPQLWQSGEPHPKEASQPIPQTRFNHPVAADRVVGHVRLDMGDLKKLEKKYTCTINDIALCAVAGALRHYLAEQGEFPVEDLVAAMPIDMRRRHKDGDIGNQVSVARIHLHATVEDPRQRLTGIQAQTRQSKKQTGKQARKGVPPPVLDIVDDIHPAIIIWLGQWLITSGYYDKMPPMVNTVITNVPGISSQAYLFGARLVDYLGFGPLAPNVGLFHTVSSTPDHVNISFTSTAEFIGDGTDYCAALEVSHREIIELLQG